MVIDSEIFLKHTMNLPIVNLIYPPSPKGIGNFLRISFGYQGLSEIRNFHNF